MGTRIRVYPSDEKTPYSGVPIEYKADGTVLLFGQRQDTIEWGYHNEISSLTHWFGRCYSEASDRDRKAIFETVEDNSSDTQGKALLDYMKEVERTKLAMIKQQKREAGDGMWIRVSHSKQRPDGELGSLEEFPLGDLESIYVETGDLKLLDELVMSIYNSDVFSSIFTLTIFDGDEPFERYVNNDKSNYHVFNKKSIGDLVTTMYSLRNELLLRDDFDSIVNDQAF